MGNVFYEGRPNFPANEIELRKRLAEVEKLINNDDNVSYVNIEFVNAAGQLMQDCGLITENNLRFLCDAASCQRFDSRFKFPYNPGEGPLRRVNYDNDVMGYNARGKENGQRFYHGEDRRLELLNGQHYLFSNDWYADRNPTSNKRQFYKWLAMKARKNCETVWNRQVSSNPFGGDEKITIEITEDLLPEFNGEKVDAVKANKPDDLSKIISLLKTLHAKVDALTVAIEELKRH